MIGCKLELIWCRKKLLEDYIVVEETHVDDEVYLGGQVDRSLLGSYEDRVARQLWNNVVSNDVETPYMSISHALIVVVCYLH